jgi:Ca-activated chloride channel homolog
MLLRGSEFKQKASYDNAWKLAKSALGNDEEGYRSEFLKLLKSVESLARNDKMFEVQKDDEVGAR